MNSHMEREQISKMALKIKILMETNYFVSNNIVNFYN